MRYKSHLRDIFYCFALALPLIGYAVMNIVNCSKYDMFDSPATRTTMYNLENLQPVNSKRFVPKSKSAVSTTVFLPPNQEVFQQSVPNINVQSDNVRANNMVNSEMRPFSNSFNQKINPARESYYADNRLIPFTTKHRRNETIEPGLFDGLKLSDLSTANEGQPFFTVNSSGSEDDFEEGGTTDPDGTYNDAPLGDGTFFLFLLTIVYVLVKNEHHKKSHHNNLTDKKQTDNNKQIKNNHHRGIAP